MKLVILDRDGVINEDSKEFIKTPAEWRPLPGSVEAIARLTAAGFTVTVATNQSGLARGLLDEATLAAIHHKMTDAVTAAGGRLEAIHYCPHLPDDHCDCRKPEPGLLRAIAARFQASLRAVPVIGDSERDIEAARRVDARPMLVLTGSGRTALEALGARGTLEVYNDLSAAADRLVAEQAVR
jgi:D-glycero-D-manno-heptose 1,7-bisphosphate phosphatase